MRILIPFFIVCALAIGWFLYLEHDTKKFIESLPKPPAPPEETTNEFLPAEQPVLSTEVAPSVMDESPAVKSTEEAAAAPHTHSHEHEGTVQSHQTGTYNRRTDRRPYTPPQAKQDPLRKRKAPFEGLRERLVKKYGDIPEVHQYLELQRKHHNKEQLTQGEVMTYWELTVKFHPTKRNLETYEVIKRLTDKADATHFQVDYDD